VKIAFVCTGNRFRSPLAAALLEANTRGLPVEIASLGTLDLGREPALPEAVDIARGLGLDLSGHRARSIRGVDLGAYDLVLGFERKNLMASVVDANSAIERTFTLPELVELLQRIPGPPLPNDAVERARVLLRGLGFRHRRLEQSNFSQISSRHGSGLFSTCAWLRGVAIQTIK